MRFFSSLLILLGLLTCPLPGQVKSAVTPGEAPGPWIFGTIGVGKGEDGKTPLTTALKGVAIRVGAKGEAAVAYDLDLCRMAGAWTGGKLTTPINLMSRGEYPVALGPALFTSDAVPGWVVAAHAAGTAGGERAQGSGLPEGSSQPLADSVLGAEENAGAAIPWKDPRPEPYGPLPTIRYRGLHTSGDRVVLTWEVEGVEILEAPSYLERDGWCIITRNFHMGPSERPFNLELCRVPQAKYATSELFRYGEKFGWDHLAADSEGPLEQRLAVVSNGKWSSRDIHVSSGRAFVTIPPSAEARNFSLVIATRADALGDLSKVEKGAVGKSALDALVTAVEGMTVPDLSTLTHGGPARWPETVETAGEVSASPEAYVVDTVKLPDPNPWKAPMFLGGFDFFPDGRAAVCTFHGDVFIVSGLDAKLEHVVWKRFATGLYHALGLKIVNGEIYVTERSGITRLRDLNGDGEADFYEAFNWDVKVTKSFHEFVFDLQTDPAGNFFFAKAGPVKNGGRGFDEICEHHGTLLRVSPDGAKLDVYATGFRAPNGIGVGPEGQITSGDNEGTWTPVCRLNWITQSGFYGCVPTAHWAQPPIDYMKPLCWLPKRVDNSAGSQVWVTSDRWGPWQGQMLHLSYGTCTLFGVMAEQVHLPEAPECCEYQMQGGVTAFPLRFQSGIMRARFNPADGQLYVAGLRGWQTTGAKNGAFQRVRYTGAPTYMPVALSAQKEGVQVRFASSLDTQQACDPENWSVEVWNYIWSSAYGSPEVSTRAPAEAPGEQGKEDEGQFTKAQMSKSQHDTLTVQSITMGTDDRTVFLQIPDLKPAMQMDIKYRLKAADGHEIQGEVVNTVHGFAE